MAAYLGVCQLQRYLLRLACTDSSRCASGFQMDSLLDAQAIICCRAVSMLLLPAL